MRFLAVVATLALAAPAHGQEEPLPDADAMRAIEAAVPPQPWYPDGYYDVRIAAEAEMADAPDAGKKLLRDPPETPQQGFRLRIDTYRIDNCSPRKLDPDLGDPITQHYAASALEVARLRSVFGRMQFSPAIYADSLLKFERRLLSRDAGTDTSEADPYAELAAAVEANRLRLAPELLGVTSSRCAAVASAVPRRAMPMRGIAAAPSPTGVTLATVPAAGEVLLINAFAFKVCMRKQADPWDRFACKWNEVETGIARPLSGRFVYQVRWPDGTVRKGTREIIAGQNGAAASTVTFKKTGS